LPRRRSVAASVALTVAAEASAELPVEAALNDGKLRDQNFDIGEVGGGGAGSSSLSLLNSAAEAGDITKKLPRSTNDDGVNDRDCAWVIVAAVGSLSAAGLTVLVSPADISSDKDDAPSFSPPSVQPSPFSHANMSVAHPGDADLA
jgi:hypothetical protein